MKKIIFIIITLFTLSPLFSMTDNYRSMKQMNDAIKDFSKIIEKKDYEIVCTQVDNITKVSSRDVYREMSKDWSYTIFAFCDWRIKNIVVDVYKQSQYGDWIYLSGTTYIPNEYHSYIKVKIRPEEDGLYKFVINASHFNKGYDTGHYGLILYHN